MQHAASDPGSPDRAITNCWLVLQTSEQGEHRFVAKNKATAWMMLDHYMHEAEEAEHLPTHLLLCWRDENGQEHIRVDVHIGDVPQRQDVNSRDVVTK